MPDFPYQRIISLVPSLTELLFDLGLEEQIIGRTRFCVHPKPQIEDVKIIGGTKNPKLETIIELKPDFILANKEENRKEDIDILRKYADVRVTEIDIIQDAILEITALGKILGAAEKAQQLTQKITELLDNRPKVQPKSVAYFIWKDPWMAAGNDTYIHDMLRHYQLENIFAEQPRYPQTSLKEVAEKQPDLILLSSEPYPFKEKHIPEVQNACPAATIKLVDGEWFSWYGSRMITALSELNKWRNSL